MLQKFAHVYLREGSFGRLMLFQSAFRTRVKYTGRRVADIVRFESISMKDSNQA